MTSHLPANDGPLPDGVWTAHAHEDAQVRHDGLWWACDEPERPSDANVVWHYHECAACQMKAELLAVLYPDDSYVAWLNRVMQGGAGE